MSEIHDKARHKITFLLNSTSGLFGVDRTEVVDTLVELLAENERLRRWRDLALKYDAERMQQRARAEVAEGRLRDLANEEPVAWVDGFDIVWTYQQYSELHPLIRRPTL